MRRTRTRLAVALIAAATPIAAAGCSSGGSASAGPVTLSYALWDQTQQAGYQACADAFTAQDPNIKIKITQAAWSNYWQNLTTEMTAGDAPDVFTDHVAYYPQFVADNQIMDLTADVTSAQVNLGQYQPGLADMWVDGGKRYGLPKDWDTEGLVYNTKMLTAAGVSPSSLDSLTWNPTDGGTFEQLIAKLTIDENGNNGLSPKFDKSHVKVYGYVPTYDDGNTGQSSWGDLAVENGFSFLPKPFSTAYNYASPALEQTVTWYASLAQKGYAPPYQKNSTLGVNAVLDAGQGAMTQIGSYNVSSYAGPTAKQSYGFAELPIGPDGRKTLINDLSDAIWSGTKYPTQAWKWISFLASPACQDIVATKGVIFPAITEATKKAETARIAAGQNITPFVQEAQAPGGTFIYPISQHESQISTEVQSQLDAVWLGQASAASALETAQSAVSGYMSQP
ncbi:sugar ABC transporter substrate-binding protein [Actinospica sp. MGRD01-02]|uniref:Sugar ABC transporter substrate-binding protein n=1 Tax=Actinospica acidithermotolerans TaxID=2828514 RepID=A0A941ECK6_9ACTN|nr:sugar ABC transporter substrate-binding protein [Actinospica acidithermotolerans]MBR7827890.1 sugar ABC transporter substrate-binding protein [Actinospica acidithermotolerans]